MDDAGPVPDDRLTILPSVEAASAPEVESEFLTVSTPDPQLRDYSPANVNEIRIPLDDGPQHGPTPFFGMFRNLRQWFAGTFSGLTAINLNMRWLPNLNIQTPQDEPATSLPEEIEMLTIRPVRNMLRRNPRTSPLRRLPAVAPTSSPIAKRATGGSDVLRARQATPIRRSRSSYSVISQSRRTEASGRIDRTLYRLPDLVSQNQSTKTSPEPETYHDAQKEQTVHVEAPVTPKLHPPSTPVTAPAATTATDSDGSPSLPRWIFNNISRKWTSIREKWGARPTVTNDDSMDVEQVATRSSPKTPPAAPGESIPSATPVQTAAPPTEEVPRRVQTFSRSVRRASLYLPPRNGPRRPRQRRTSTTTTQPPQPSTRARPEPAIERPSKLPYDLFPAGLSQEVLDRCYAGSTGPRHLGAGRIVESIEATQLLEAPGPSAPSENQLLKRKREEPETIPNPKGCSYGMDLDYFEFTDEEWAEEEKRQAELAAAKETTAPAAKKQRVEEPPQQRRRIPTTALSPARRPGFIPNRRGTYQAPELPTIDSSGLLSDIVSSPAAPPQPPAAVPRPSEVAPTSEPAQTPSPVRRVRSKAEQFKPKTPSRLRESHHLPSSVSSETPSQLGGAAGTPLLFSDSMSVDTSLGHVVTADDVDWLLELCPGGDLQQLSWPERAGLGETLGVAPPAVALVSQNWNDEKAQQASGAWKRVFENFDDIM